jgi:hypothetical protein
MVSEIDGKNRREILEPKEGARIRFLDWSADSRLLLLQG